MVSSTTSIRAISDNSRVNLVEALPDPPLLPDLIKLFFSYLRFTDDELQKLSPVQAIRFLNQELSTTQALTPLAACRYITYYRKYGGISLSLTDLAKKCHTLKKINLCNSTITDMGLCRWLAVFRKIPHWNLSGCSKITNDSVVLLSSLRDTLLSLDLSSTPVSKISSLARCAMLRRLNIENCKIRDVSVVETFMYAKSLKLGTSPHIQEKTIVKICSLEDLTKITLSAPHIPQELLTTVFKIVQLRKIAHLLELRPVRGKKAFASLTQNGQNKILEKQQGGKKLPAAIRARIEDMK